MTETSLLKYPKKSHRKSVILPSYSINLAEFFGIMIGDGGINNDWQANITVNSTTDYNYSKYIADLCTKLFNLKPTIRKRKNSNALTVSISSTSLVDFLVSNGLPRGNKLKKGLSIPSWVISKPAYQIACVRGLIDTDGCIFIHTHRVAGKVYKNIGLTFSNRSSKLIFQVADILQDFGINPHITKRGWEIFLYQADAVAKYLKIFSTSNSRIESVYKQWRGGRAV